MDVKKLWRRFKWDVFVMLILVGTVGWVNGCYEAKKREELAEQWRIKFKLCVQDQLMYETILHFYGENQKKLWDCQDKVSLLEMKVGEAG